MPLEKCLEKFFIELNINSVRYCVLRNYEQLPQSTGGSDIDMWVYQDDLAKCDDAIKATVKECGMSLVTYYSNESSMKVGLQCCDGGVQIDVFKGSIFLKNKELFDAESILKRKKTYNGISVLEDDFADFLALMKELLNNGKIKDKYVAPIYEKAEFFVENLGSYLPNFKKNFVESLSAAIENRTIKENAAELKQLAIRNFCYCHKVSNLGMLFEKITRSFGPRPGYVIAVEGTDGSGKSFIINSITPILNGAFHNGVIYNHLRPNWLPDLAVVLGKRKKPAPGEEVKVVSDPHAGKQSGFAVSLVRWGWYMLDYTLGYLKKVWIQIHSKSKVFIFDRYYYEFYLDQKRSHVKLPHWVIKFGEFFIPKPDLILCLGGEPQKIYARKPETSLEEVSRQTAVLREFCRNRKNAVWIDTTVNPEESVNAAMTAINEVMGKRFNLDDIR